MNLMQIAAVCFLIPLYLCACEKSDSNKPVAQEQSNFTISELKEKIGNSATELEKFYLKSDVVKKYSHEKLTTANSAEAKEFAESIISTAENYKDDWNYGNAIHHGNLVLGRIALQSGNITAAKESLKVACQVKGSPQLDSFGPNMTLAKELLEKKEKEAVLAYIDTCLKFWKPSGSDPDVVLWKKQIREGNVPDFKGNLVY